MAEIDDIGKAIAVLLLENVPDSYCFPCLAAQLQLSEREVRKAASPLVLLADFRIRRLRCRICRTEDDLLLTPEPDRWSGPAMG
jgi:hypothetical protein